MAEDFSAAHSADTSWYAVDKDGHVASFYSGEAGAVPAGAAAVSAYAPEDEAELVELEEVLELGRWLEAHFPRAETIYDLQGRTLPAPVGDRLHMHPDHGWDGVLMFLKSLEPVQSEVVAGNAVPVASTTGVAVVFRRLSAVLTRQLHEAGHCFGCFSHSLPEGRQDDESIRRRGDGLYHYGHPSANIHPAPYGRESLPRVPIHIDQLPPRLRGLVGQVCFESLCFAEAVFVQPCELGLVTGFGEYLSLTANGLELRPMTPPAARR